MRGAILLTGSRKKGRWATTGIVLLIVVFGGIAWRGITPRLAQHKWYRGRLLSISINATHDGNMVEGSTARLVLTYRPMHRTPFVTYNPLDIQIFGPDTWWIDDPIEMDIGVTLKEGRAAFAPVETNLPSWAGYVLASAELKLPYVGDRIEDEGLCQRDFRFDVSSDPSSVMQGERWRTDERAQAGVEFERRWVLRDGALEVVFHCAQRAPVLPSSVDRVAYTIDSTRFVIPVIQNSQGPGWTWAGTWGLLSGSLGARLGVDTIELPSEGEVRLAWYREAYHTRATAPQTFNVSAILVPEAEWARLAIASKSVSSNWNTIRGAMTRKRWEAVFGASIHPDSLKLTLGEHSIDFVTQGPLESRLVLVMAATIEGEDLVGYGAHYVSVRAETRDLVGRLVELSTSRSDADRREGEALLRRLGDKPFSP